MPLLVEIKKQLWSTWIMKRIWYIAGAFDWLVSLPIDTIKSWYHFSFYICRLLNFFWYIGTELYIFKLKSLFLNICISKRRWDWLESMRIKLLEICVDSHLSPRCWMIMNFKGWEEVWMWVLRHLILLLLLILLRMDFLN